MSRKIIVGLFCWWLLAGSPATAMALMPTLAHAVPPAVIQTVFTDNFSSLDQWVAGIGNKDDWILQDGWVATNIITPSTVRQLVIAPAIWKQEWINYQVEFEYWPVEGADRNLSWNYLDPLNWYDYHLVGSALDVLRMRDGIYTLNLSEHYQLDNGRAYKIKLAHWDEHIQLYIDDALIVVLIEPLARRVVGRPTLRAGTGAAYPTTIKVRNFKVSLIGPQLNGALELLVPEYKQNDPIWAKQEYDHGTAWSTQPTIGRWGCALTSLAMVLNYYGFTQFIDGSLLNPQTLNDWYKNQADGFFGTGSVNWIAATRLVHQLVVDAQKKSPTAPLKPDLEFSRWDGFLPEKIKVALLAAQPVIGQISGHFLVVRGFTDSLLTDFFITDPFYSFTRFSQHNTPLTGGRLYTPSHTDLSYWLLELPSDAEFEVRDAAGKLVTGWVKEDTLTPDGELLPDDLLAQQPPMAVYSLPKPELGSYTLTVSGETGAEFKVKWWAYDKTAQTKLWQQTGWQSPEGMVATLNYAKDSVDDWGADVIWHYTWADWVRDLQVMKDDSWFTVGHPFRILFDFAQLHAAFETTTDWPVVRQKDYFNYRVEVARKIAQAWHYLLTDPAYNRIMQQLDWLEAAYAQIK